MSDLQLPQYHVTTEDGLPAVDVLLVRKDDGLVLDVQTTGAIPLEIRHNEHSPEQVLSELAAFVRDEDHSAADTCALLYERLEQLGYDLSELDDEPSDGDGTNEHWSDCECDSCQHERAALDAIEGD